MLKIEKKADLQHLSISVREKTRLLTPTFKSAFILAFCLHLVALILFHVQPFRINQSHTLFPPVQVNIEIALPNSAIFADLDKHSPRFPYIEEPAWPTPLIPNIFLSPSFSQSISPRDSVIPPAPFLANPLDGAIASWINLSPKKRTQNQKNQLYIFGPLSEVPLFVDSIRKTTQNMNEIDMEISSWQDEIFKSFSTNGDRVQNRISRFLYDVKVNNHTGKVFWYQPLVSNRSPKGEKLAESILRTIQFETTDNVFVTHGQIELFLRETAQ